MDIVERLRNVQVNTIHWVKCHDAADEIEQLREDKAKLLEALKFYSCDCQCLDGCSIADCGDVARKAIAKATGGK